MNMLALADLVGTDEPLEPSQMRFTSKPAKSCHGCLFDGQRSPVCRQASFVAMRAGLADCDDGVVYVTLPEDPRQLTIKESP